MKQFIIKLLHNLSDLLKNGGKRWSSIRFGFLLSVLLSNFIIFGVWSFLSITSMTMVPIDNSILVLYAISNGLHISGKLIQKPMENKNNKEEN